jgi:hypothetical protein
MPSPIPRQDRRDRSLVLSHRLRPSLDSRRVSSCITLFGACTAFTFVTAYQLAKSPKRPSTPEASAASLPPLLLRLLPGGANQFPGGISPLWTSAFSRRTWSRGVARWFRRCLSVADPFVCRCLTSSSCSVSTPRSSNRTCAFRASGSRRKAHEVAHGKLRVRAVSRTKPSSSCKAASGNCLVAGQDTLCLAHSH